MAPFKDFKSAVQATVEIMQTGLNVKKKHSTNQINLNNFFIKCIKYGLKIARIEFLDDKSIHANNVYNKMKLDETPTLFLEFHGSKDTVEQQAELASEFFAFLSLCNRTMRDLFYIYFVLKWKYVSQMSANLLTGLQTQKSATNCGKRDTIVGSLLKLYIRTERFFILS